MIHLPPLQIVDNTLGFLQGDEGVGHILEEGRHKIDPLPRRLLVHGKGLLAVCQARQEI